MIRRRRDVIWMIVTAITMTKMMMKMKKKSLKRNRSLFLSQFKNLSQQHKLKREKERDKITRRSKLRKFRRLHRHQLVRLLKEEKELKAQQQRQMRLTCKNSEKKSPRSNNNSLSKIKERSRKRSSRKE